MNNIFSRCLCLLTTTSLVLTHPLWSQTAFAEQNETILAEQNETVLAEQNETVFVSTLLSTSPSTATSLIAREHYLYVSSPHNLDIQFQGDQSYPILFQLDRALVNPDGLVLIPAGADIMAQLSLSNGTTQIVAERILIEGMEVTIQAASPQIPVQTSETQSEAEKMANFLTYAEPISRASGSFLFEDQQVGEFVSGAVPYILGALFIDADVEHKIHFPANQSIPLMLDVPVTLPVDIARAIHGEQFFSTIPTNGLHNP